MIALSLDSHDFLYAVEGFARGSHLRQHVWEQIVYRSIPQMSCDDMDFLWFYMRRNLWECYFFQIGGELHKQCGYDDYLHALAALHRGNRFLVTFRAEGKGRKKHHAECYRFNGAYHPLYADGKMILQPFHAFIPSEWVIECKQRPMPDNPHVELGKEEWWRDTSVYEDVE